MPTQKPRVQVTFKKSETFNAVKRIAKTLEVSLSTAVEKLVRIALKKRGLL
jgi:hypothetical protein